MTVSNVLNNRAGSASEALALDVRRKAEELGYRPHSAARRLRTRRTQAIGVVLLDPSPYFLSDPLTAAMLAGLTAALGRQNHSSLLHGIPPDQVETAPILQAIETDGICVILSGPEAQRRNLTRRLASLNQPLVVLQERVADDVVDAACVYLDDRRGARQLLQGLLRPDTGRIMMLAPALEWAAMVRREAGLRAALAETGSSADLKVVRSGGEGFEATQDALARALDEHGPPDILVGGNDQMAIAGMNLLQARGLRVPEDVQVAGFNGLEFSRFSVPRLSTVMAPAFDLGESAGQAMLARLTNGAFPFRELVVPVRPEFHGSTLRQPGG